MSVFDEFTHFLDDLIAEVARERGEDPEEFKQSLLAKIKADVDVPRPHQKRIHESSKPEVQP